MSLRVDGNNSIHLSPMASQAGWLLPHRGSDQEANTTVGLKTADNEAEWNAAFTASAESSSNFVNEEGWTSFSQEKFTETYEEAYNDSYSQAYETATTNANQAVSQTEPRHNHWFVHHDRIGNRNCSDGSLGRKP